MTSRSTVLDRASAQNAQMISASRCSMVIRQGLPGDERPGGADRQCTPRRPLRDHPSRDAGPASVGAQVIP